MRVATWLLAVCLTACQCGGGGSGGAGGGSAGGSAGGGSAGGGSAGGGSAGGGSAGGGSAGAGSAGAGSAGGGSAGAGSAGGSTGGGSDTTPPSLVSVAPPNGAIDVSFDASVTLTFNEPVNCASAMADGGVRLSSASGGVPVAVSCPGATVVMTPSALLDWSTTYSVSIGTSVADLAGNRLPASSSTSFTTEERTAVIVDVVGLRGTGLVVQLNGGDDLTFSASGSQRFPLLLDGTPYQVTIKTQPMGPRQVCVVEQGGAVASLPVEVSTVRCREGRYAVVASGEDRSLHSYVIDADTGGLKWAGAVTAPTTPLSVTFHPRLDVLYALTAGTIETYAFAPDGVPYGRVQTFTSLGNSSFAIDPQGRWAYAVDSMNGRLRQLPVSPTGALPAANPPSIAVGAGALDVAIHPSGTFVYVARGTSNDVAQFSVAPDGGLAPLSPATVGAGPNAVGVVIDPTGRFLYTANSGPGTVGQYVITDAGTLQPMTPGAVMSGAGTNDVVVHPSGRFLYALNGGANSVSGFTIDGGALQPNGGFFTGAGPTQLAIDAAGRSLYVANGAGNALGQLTIGADGTLAPLPPGGLAAPLPNGIAVQNGDAPVSASVTQAYSLSFESTNRVRRFDVDAGAFTAVGAPIDLGTGPQLESPQVVVHPSNRFIYFRRCYRGSTVAIDTFITSFVVQPDGTLVNRKEHFFNGRSNDLVFHPNGRFAYLSAGWLFQLAVDPVSGELTALNPGVTQGLPNRVQGVVIDIVGFWTYIALQNPPSVVRGYLQRDGNIAINHPVFGLASYPQTADPYSMVGEPYTANIFVINQSQGTINTYAPDFLGLIPGPMPMQIPALAPTPRLSVGPPGFMYQPLDLYFAATMTLTPSIVTWQVGTGAALTRHDTTLTASTPTYLTYQPQLRRVYSMDSAGDAGVIWVHAADGGSLLPLPSVSTPQPAAVGFITRLR